MSRWLNVPPALAEALRREGLHTVEGAFAYHGGQDLTRAGLGHREWIRIRLDDGSGHPAEMYMKRYAREPLSWRARRLLTYGPRRSPAGVELANIRAARAAGIPTIERAVCGEELDLLGTRRSYIIVSAVPGEAMDRCGEDFFASHQDDPEALGLFTRKLIDLVGRLHEAGYVHRDLYSSHIFLAEGAEPELYLIDLARMFRPRWRRFRWRVKDLAQLKYSMPEPWVRRCWKDFLRGYLGRGRRLQRLGRAIDRKVERIRRHDRHKRLAHARTGAERACESR